MACAVIIDTDIGDDIDDALALALAVRAPELELVGVTTVYQCAELRARLARYLLQAYGRGDVPVRAGSDRPLAGPLDPAWHPNQAAVLPAEARVAPVDGGAVEWIVQQARRRDGLVLLTLGPMTNAALALQQAPELARHLRVVAMAGAWDRQEAEYNVACDPEAVAAVLAAGAQLSFVGLDVTTRMVLQPEELLALRGATGRAERALAQFGQAWQAAVGSARAPVLHDPLAVAAVFRPEDLQWRRAHVAVELAAPAGRGRTAFGDGPANAQVACGLRGDFVAFFRRRVLQAAASP